MFFTDCEASSSDWPTGKTVPRQLGVWPTWSECCGRTGGKKKKEIACWGLLYIQTANSRRCRGTFFLSEFSYINLISICIVSAPTGLSQHLHASSCFPAYQAQLSDLQLLCHSEWNRTKTWLPSPWETDIKIWHVCGTVVACQCNFVHFVQFSSSWDRCPSGTRIKCSQSSANFATIGSSLHKKLGVWLAKYREKAQESNRVLTSSETQKLLPGVAGLNVQRCPESSRFCQTSSNICPKPSSNSVFATPTPRKWQWISRNESDEKSSTFKHLQYLVSDLYSICTTLHCTLQTGYNIIYNFPNRQENVELFQQVLPSFVAKLVRDLASPASRILQWHAMVSNSFAFCCHKPCLTEQTLHICSPRVHAFVL